MTDTTQGGLFDEPSAPPAAPAPPVWPCKDRCLAFGHLQPHEKATDCGRNGCVELRAARERSNPNGLLKESSGTR